MVWNTKFKKTTPEDVFHCQSAVMSACYAKFHPNLILGGTYSGQIVLWDNRVQKRTPIHRSPLNSTAHTVRQLNEFSNLRRSNQHVFTAPSLLFSYGWNTECSQRNFGIVRW